MVTDRRGSAAAATSEELLRRLEAERAAHGLSKAELARQSEVRPETVRDLLTRSNANPTLNNVLSLLRPLGLGLGLVELEPGPDASTLRAWLAHYGGALHGASTVTGTNVPPPEWVLAEALALSHDDASVARALPSAIWKCRQRLDMERLRREATSRGQARTLGFFLELTGRLAADSGLAREARKLSVRLPAKATEFFQDARPSPYERRLSSLRTPAVAKRWRYRMNLSLESFESTFNKATT